LRATLAELAPALGRVNGKAAGDLGCGDNVLETAITLQTRDTPVAISLAPTTTALPSRLRGHQSLGASPSSRSLVRAVPRLLLIGYGHVETVQRVVDTRA
jgi:hypothetical protein